VKVVVNATLLIALALIEKLDLLKLLFDEVIVPSAVYEEIAVQGIGRIGAPELSKSSWIQVQSPQSAPVIEPMLLGLDLGELQALLLARELEPDWVIIDERFGGRVAQAMGLPVKGTLGVLLAAFFAGLLSKEEAQASVQCLIQGGIRLSPRLVEWFEAELERANSRDLAENDAKPDLL
jgi:predicted nucleic acid-binding protein